MYMPRHILPKEPHHQTLEHMQHRHEFMKLELLSTASRGSVAFAVTSCTLSAVLAFFTSGAAAAAYTIAYSVIAVQTLDAFRYSRIRCFFALDLKYLHPAFLTTFGACCRIHLLWSCILIGGTAVGACASPHVNLRMMLLLLSVIVGIQPLQ